MNEGAAFGHDQDSEKVRWDRGQLTPFLCYSQRPSLIFRKEEHDC